MFKFRLCKLIWSKNWCVKILLYLLINNANHMFPHVSLTAIIIYEIFLSMFLSYMLSSSMRTALSSLDYIVSQSTQAAYHMHVFAKMNGTPHPNKKWLPALGMEPGSLNHEAQPFTIRPFLTPLSWQQPFYSGGTD